MLPMPITRRFAHLLPASAASLLACIAPGVPATGAAAAEAAATQPAPERARTEAELEQIRAEIDRIRAQIRNDGAERDRIARELRTAEQAVSGARGEMERLRRERAEHARRRTALAAERRERVTALAAERTALAAQMRTAYLIGRQEPLELVLNQRDPVRAGRMFAYYSYFGRARASQIAQIEEHVARIEELDGELVVEDARLAGLEAQQAGEVQRLERARSGRREVLASLAAEARSRTAALARLRQQRDGLEKLLRELRRTVERFPADTVTTFGRSRGKLGWPVGGALVARFGEARAGAVKWDGVLIATERAAPVKAVAAGRVLYADWLAGLGLLVIVDHGDGYLSLYGHNEQVYKRVGEKVVAGDTLAAAGDTGGSARPELYFEIRRGGKPIDPRPWFATANP
jgi:septal ring factor EnvC (AmiA/AmiB activator)